MRSLPSLRSAGISIAQLDRALSLVSVFKNADQQNSNATAPSTPVLLHTDDITRGFAYDVWNSQTQTWNSLHERVGTYNFLDPNGNTVSTQQVSDEGWIQLAATQAADGSSSDLYVHETIFRWTGWPWRPPGTAWRLPIRTPPSPPRLRRRDPLRFPHDPSPFLTIKTRKDTLG